MDIGKISIKNSPVQEEKQREEPSGEVQEVQEDTQATQPLQKDWKYAPSHFKDIILGDVYRGVSTTSKLQDICDYFAFISYI